MKLVNPTYAKKLQKELSLMSARNFDYRLFNDEGNRLSYRKLPNGEFERFSPTCKSTNLFQREKIKDCLDRAKEIFEIDKFFNTRGKYLYKTFCLEHEDEFYFIYIHRTKGDGIDTTCKNSLKYYRFLIKLLKKCGHNIKPDYFDRYLNPTFTIGDFKNDTK